jgi:hypothetical protein
MPIIITDQQIKAIAARIEFTNWDTNEPYSLDEKVVAVENWLRRTIHNIEQEPQWYADGSGNVDVARFEIEPECVGDHGWSKCRNTAQPHSLYCAEHQQDW